MELRHLRYFVAVADAGSLTVAAEQKLHTSQPSLSRQIRDLEQEIGVQLMNRGAHGIELTSDPLIFVFPSDHRLASQVAVAPEEIVNEIFYFPSKAAPAVRRAVLEYFNRAGLDLKPEYEVHNVVHAISMITSMRAVMLLPAYTRHYLPETITTRPVKGEVPTLDLVIAYHKSNNSPILKLLLSRAGKLAGAPS